ncbi:bifunctional DedA family/phosphatase PAP2 family protein [Marinobacter zhejiangensis]|uniref:Undecaprenyl-diphosphatase n=1 Tax=Marinobacter zhejiangensis TaxID=488535 RepID=A0A1I4TD91_9GAMM|nr:bifunctional DedA family/phosphatase PAP2 family protein [Marinobacter zhejiangensis]SFM74704.1 undecaprenyl-diphosphatase [Marinobacter zhejiangensis]
MSTAWLSAFTDWLSVNPGWLAATLFLVAFLESLAVAGIVVPGVAILFAVSVLAGKVGVPLADALLWAGLGAIAGDGLSFWLGRCFQGRLDRIWPFSRYPSLLNKGERFFLQHGGKSVVIGRFVGPIRPIIPLVAGALLMPWQRFLTFNVLSAVGWAVAYIAPGYLIGSTLEQSLELPRHFYPILAAAMATLALVYLLLFRVQIGLSSNSEAYSRLASWMGKYNSTHRFWREMSSHRPATGGEFPLPSLILAVGAFALFALLSLLVAHTPLFHEANQSTAQFFSNLRNPLLDPAFVLISGLGDTVMLMSAGVLGLLAFGFRGYYAAALHILGAMVLGAGLILAFKAGLNLPRPELAAQPPASAAFPSGHTAGVTIALGLLASFIAREQVSNRRWRIYLISSLPMVLVGISRLYLGVHWLTDVMGGVLLGLAICGVIRASFSRYDQTPLWFDSTFAGALVVWLTLAAAHLSLTWSSAMSAYQALP